MCGSSVVKKKIKNPQAIGIVVSSLSTLMPCDPQSKPRVIQKDIMQPSLLNAGGYTLIEERGPASKTRTHIGSTNILLSILFAFLVSLPGL
ncbi:hypothetical protein FRB94_012353 [Tulasnella sp. JGI-2019a]|nr:hypothetical protein FRB93_010416 [Tulasnella sp. JGI-2019a]KAG8991664.1 hypothetical protein FRB94_012353 [Tulasnella sp. JGI-2019a]